jgi:aspartate-semialdehyde dehydrogenase
MIGVAVLGATGLVGQRFVRLLAAHPYFEIRALLASERSVGKKYGKAARWYLDAEMPEEVRDLEVRPCDPRGVEAEIAFSALPSAIAKKVEPRFAEAGLLVASNASAYRREADIPLVIPEVNPDHLDLLPRQREERGWDGGIITNPNCTTIMAVLSLKPLHDRFQVRRFFLTSMQGLSGAGYGGVSSMAITDNLIPFIRGEEEKVESEVLKILGRLDGDRIVPADLEASASCNRVAVLEGHTESVVVDTEEPVDPAEAKEVLRRFRGLPQELGLPTAPKQPIHVREEEDRPQPRLDRNTEGGMAVTVGRVRKDPILDLKYVVTGHNTIRGAAGASLLNAELLVETKRL